MALLTDLISPATLTGFTRAAFENYESNSDSLNVYLPNQTTPCLLYTSDAADE